MKRAFEPAIITPGTLHECTLKVIRDFKVIFIAKDSKRWKVTNYPNCFPPAPVGFPMA